ncbi:CLUMA_CG003718, isoform A [Clunio marinus]|uniref:CLUMA_CG003718, isoform A n=1 Tax=Clunio marinus TaxID=568069 RepID=A0A1J1HPL8_9DIPT|nr:CLUMA_CG003718, isoform A [Clunio marinus]
MVIHMRKDSLFICVFKTSAEEHISLMYDLFVIRFGIPVLYRLLLSQYANFSLEEEYFAKQLECLLCYKLSVKH